MRFIGDFLGSVLGFFSQLFEEHKFARRGALAWAIWLISVVVLRVTEPETLAATTAASATVITAIIGILTTVIGFYQWSRDREDRREDLDKMR